MNFKELKKSVLLFESLNEDRYKKVFNAVLSNIKILKNINTKNVKPSHLPYELERTKLRADEEIRVVGQEKIRENTTFEGDYVVIKTGENNE